MKNLAHVSIFGFCIRIRRYDEARFCCCRIDYYEADRSIHLKWRVQRHPFPSLGVVSAARVRCTTAEEISEREDEDEDEEATPPTYLLAEDRGGRR